MRNFLLKKIRLSWYFIIFFELYVVLVLVLPKQAFEGGSLALFSVNSFLYGFYIAPILASQKARIEDLHRIARAEANAIFAMVIGLKKLPKHLRNEIQDMFIAYLKASLRERKPAEGEARYEAMITFCLDYKGEHQEDVDKLLEKLVANQQNRTNMAMQLSNAVFSNEWFIMLVLFSITQLFILLIDTGGNLGFKILAALLCTGLSMLLLILVKLSTLTHKKAKLVWEPYHKLITSHFYRID